MFADKKENKAISFQIAIHQAWEGSLRRFVTMSQTNSLDPNVISDDTACPFGKWLNRSDVFETIRSVEFYDTITALHREFHCCAGEVLYLVQNNYIDTAEKMLEPNGRYCVVSRNLITAMHDLENWQSNTHKAVA